jgi:serine/threonine protein kinase
MEYLEGGSLRARMRPGRPWPAAEALPVLNAIAAALGYVHSRGLLHLDLNPENVLCDGRGTVKVSDFGLAQAQADAAAVSALGDRQGSLDYAPPEQRFGLPVDGRADLFALATLAYELLTGRVPGRVFVPASVRNPALPAAGDEVLRTGLARDPDDRFATVEEFRCRLEAALG